MKLKKKLKNVEECLEYDADYKITTVWNDYQSKPEYEVFFNCGRGTWSYLCAFRRADQALRYIEEKATPRTVETYYYRKAEL